MSSARGTTPRRATGRLGVLALAAIGAAVGFTVSSVAPTMRGAATPPEPDAVSGTVQSSAFYCAGLADLPGTLVGDVAIADLASTPRLVEVTASDAAGHVATREVLVAPGRVVRMRPGTMVPGTTVAATLVADGGDVAVTEGLEGVNGSAAAPCATSPAASWWVVGGSTEPGQSFVVTVLNPSASRAVASVDLFTPSGEVLPGDQGIVLGPHQLAALFVHRVAPNAAPIAAHVVATDGEVVVTGVQRGTKGQAELALLPGAASGSTALLVPAASSDPGTTTALELTSPSPQGASADVELVGRGGCPQRCSAPLSVEVPADGVVTSLTLSPSDRVPLGQPFAAVVTSTRAVVASLEVVRLGRAGAAVPLDQPARREVLVDPLAVGLEELGLVNRSDREVHVTLETVGRHGAVPMPGAYTIAPGASLFLGAPRGMVDGVVEVDATGPVAAAAVLREADPGSDVLMGVPLR